MAPRQRAPREEHAGLRVRLQHEQGLIVAAQQHEIQAPEQAREQQRRWRVLAEPDVLAAIAKAGVVKRYRLSASYH